MPNWGERYLKIKLGTNLEKDGYNLFECYILYFSKILALEPKLQHVLCKLSLTACVYEGKLPLLK